VGGEVAADQIPARAVESTEAFLFGVDAILVGLSARHDGP
jgi:hypothetical protein